MNTKEAVEILRNELIRRDYSPKTITIYSNWIKKLGKFYPDLSFELIGQSEIEDYLSHLDERLQIAPATIYQAFQSFRYLFNDLLKKNIDFDKINRPNRERSNPDILTIDEIGTVINNTKNLKHRVLIALAYSTGLELSETKNLKISDVDLIRNVVKIRDTRGKVKREAVLAKNLKTELELYLKLYQPKKFFFESQQTFTSYSRTTIQKIFKNQVSKAGITKRISFRTLRFSYIIHLDQLGRPLIYTMEDLKMGSTQSLYFYTKIATRDIKNEAFSPLDRLPFVVNKELPINIESVEKAILKIRDKDEADYLKEALDCMKFGSLRAGIIFAWNAAVINIRKKCFNHGSVTLNNAIKKYLPKPKAIKKIEDFAYISDSTLLLVSQDLGIIDKGEKDSLEDCLDTRNKCGHPGKYRPKPIKAAAVIEELITIVFK